MGLELSGGGFFGAYCRLCVCYFPACVAPAVSLAVLAG